MSRERTASVRARVLVPLCRTGGRPAELVTFNRLADGREHLACVFGPLRHPPLVRVHSECLTGDLFGSLRCDCGPQLDEAFAMLSAHGGVLLYLRQEGRGIGLYNKLDSYLIQDGDVDTFEANRRLGRGPDERDYLAAAQMLLALRIEEILLITNNPDKLRQLQRYGVRVAAVRPTRTYVNPSNEGYLRAKAEIGGHRALLSGLEVPAEAGART
jgi:GTP cyclohydrolase II